MHIYVYIYIYIYIYSDAPQERPAHDLTRVAERAAELTQLGKGCFRRTGLVFAVTVIQIARCQLLDAPSQLAHDPSRVTESAAELTQLGTYVTDIYIYIYIYVYIYTYI